MDDYFARQIARATGAAPVVRPVIAPTFAPGPELLTDTATENLAAPPQRAEPKEEAVPQDRVSETIRSQPPLQNPPSPPRTVMMAPALPTVALQDLKQASKQETARQEQRTIHEAQVAPMPKSAPVPVPSLVLIERSPIARPEVAAQAVPSRPPAPIAQQPAAVVHHTEPQPARFADSSAPTIQVTIGRVEVRATAPAAEPPRKVVSRPNAGPSLEEYLKRRSRGSR